MSDLIRREDLENWLRTKCASIDTYEDKEYVIGRLREDLPTVNSWHRVEEPPKQNGAYAVCWKGSNSWGKLFYCGEWLATPGTPFPDYWMPIEPPKEDA